MVHFDLLLPEGSMPGAAWSAVDVLRELNALQKVRAPRAPSPATSWRVVDDHGRTHRFNAMTCQTDQERHGSRYPGKAQRVLLVPPLMVQSLRALHRSVKRNTAVVDLVRSRFDEGSLVGACGTGIWLVAQAGRLEQAPIPWMYQSGFADQYPAVRIEAREPIVAMHRVICAAVPPLLQALVLHLARYAGLADLAHAGAEKLLLNADRQQLSASMTAEQVMGTSRDVPLFRALSWLEANAGRPLHLGEAAAAASISERTLSRLFRQHQGQTPQQYLQALRVKRAQMWLESTWRSVDEIAHDCGYRDTSAFCRMFQRAVGTSPQRYRDRFTMRGPRALWRTGEVEAPGG